eukprot:GHVS01025955.1.p1 GENE.GHVS01025955.1~~GHVS01025955.1.p1  ORF type:complete len:482 (-),score=150.56 GHVS01025955.1:570-2015(-)
MPVTVRVELVEGFNGASNWLLFRPREQPVRCVVFFPGDLSDFFGNFLQTHSSPDTNNTPEGGGRREEDAQPPPPPPPPLPHESSAAAAQPEEEPQKKEPQKEQPQKEEPQKEEPQKEESQKEDEPKNEEEEVAPPSQPPRCRLMSSYRCYPHSLEALMWVLCSKCPADDVVLIRPATITTDGFSFFSNFIHADLDEFGQPASWQKEGGSLTAAVAALPSSTWEEEAKGVLHLEQLLRNLYHKPSAVPDHVALIGFSKGGVVLSTLIKSCSFEEPAEGAGGGGHPSTSSSCTYSPFGPDITGAFIAERLSTFWRRVRKLLFLDAALNCPGTLFAISTRQAEGLASRLAAGGGAAVELHYTPRQLLLPQKWYVRSEIQDFINLLRSAGVYVQLVEYYNSILHDRGASSAQGLLALLTLNMHFSVIWDFEENGTKKKEEEDGGAVDVHRQQQHESVLFFDLWEQIATGGGGAVGTSTTTATTSR